MTSASAFSFAPGGGKFASPATCGIYIKQSVLKIGQETTETKTTQSNKRQVTQDSEKPVGLPNNTTVPYNAKNVPLCRSRAEISPGSNRQSDLTDVATSSPQRLVISVASHTRVSYHLDTVPPPSGPPFPSVCRPSGATLLTLSYLLSPTSPPHPTHTQAHTLPRFTL